MATTPEVVTNGAAIEPVRKELVTYCLVKSTNDKGEEAISFSTEKAAQKQVEEKKGEIVASQSFVTHNAVTPEGIAVLVPSEKERVKLFNRGADQKQYQIIRAMMLETDKEGAYIFQPKEEAIDLGADLAEETTSRATNPEAKVEKILEGVGDEAAQLALLQKLMARFATQNA